MKFNIGDRVVRHEGDRLHHGIVYDRYAQGCTVDGVTHDHDEVYAVRWDDGKASKGYLPHGLQLEARP